MAAQNVIICKNLQSELQNFLQSVKYDKLFVLTDSNTLELCLPMLKEVPQLQGAPVITVEAGDTNKNIEQVTAIWMRLCNEGASRNSLLLNVGGGMITDMGGFVAATFKRGIHSVNVPTTLMASVDAAVGGKTGINFNGLKNAKAGQTVTIKTSYGNYTYEITDTAVKKATDTSAYDLSANEENLIMYTCYPFDELGLTDQRFFVYAKYVSGPQIDKTSKEG